MINNTIPLTRCTLTVFETVKAQDGIITEEIAKLTGLTEASVRSRISELRRLGLITTEQAVRTGRKVSVYRAVGTVPASANAQAEPETPGLAVPIPLSVKSLFCDTSLIPDRLRKEDALLERLNPRPRRVYIEEVNQAWLVRFLPVGLGPNKSWYLRLGQHAMGRQSICCPRYVSTDFGGNEQAKCPVCQIAEALNGDQSDEVSAFGFLLRPKLTYVSYCLAYQIDPGRGTVKDMPESEILKPWMFQHTTSSFSDLMHYFRSRETLDLPLSVLDLEKGSNFWAMRTTKGIRLDCQDPSLILNPNDPGYEARINQVFQSIAQPRVRIPTLKELDTFARQAEAIALGDDDREHPALVRPSSSRPPASAK